MKFSCLTVKDTTINDQQMRVVGGQFSSSFLLLFYFSVFLRSHDHQFSTSPCFTGPCFPLFHWMFQFLNGLPKMWTLESRPARTVSENWSNAYIQPKKLFKYIYQRIGRMIESNQKIIIQNKQNYNKVCIYIYILFLKNPNSLDLKTISYISL